MYCFTFILENFKNLQVGRVRNTHRVMQKLYYNELGLRGF